MRTLWRRFLCWGDFHGTDDWYLDDAGEWRCKYCGRLEEGE